MILSNSANNSQKFLGIFSLALINVSAIVSLRNLPMMATYGLSSIFFFAVAALLFFIPIALVCAELASGWPKQGGVYAWVREAYGDKYGFFAIWLEWIESVVWLPTVLSFVAATAAYIIDPALAQNKTFLVIVMLTVLWCMTFINFLGMRTSSLISNMGVVLGTIIPGLLIVALSANWALVGNPIAFDTSFNAIMPDLSFGTIVVFTGVLLGFGGMEIASYHVKEAKNPQRSYPIAILIATIIILTILILGSLAIAIVLPKEDISLIAGLMQAYSTFFAAMGLEKAVPYLALAILIGALALINTWIIGPSKGLYAGTLDGNLPDTFKKANKRGVPVNILLAQAIIATLLSLLFLFMPSINSSYWVINVMAAQLILMMYFFVFITVIKLRYSQPNTPRPYKIPGGKVGIWLVAGSGALSSLFTIMIGFVPPHDIQVANAWAYAGALIIGIVIFSFLPFLFMHKQEKLRNLNLQLS